MTKITVDPDQPHLAMRAVRARRLTDPLGAMGFRKTRSRVEREGRARKVAFLASIGVFTGLFGIVALDAPSNSGSVVLAQERPAATVAPTSQQQTNANGFVRSVPAKVVAKPATTHVRTRSS